MGEVIGVDLRNLPYDGRLELLLANGIGLWDVIAEAERPGSLDAAIRNEKHNALADLITTLPQLRAIGFNGGTAARHGRRHLRQCYREPSLIDLPSSSPAHTLAFEKKRLVWLQLRTYLASVEIKPTP